MKSHTSPFAAVDTSVRVCMPCTNPVAKSLYSQSKDHNNFLLTAVHKYNHRLPWTFHTIK